MALIRTNQMRGHQPDYVLALGVFVLLAIGLVMMYSMSPVLSHKHIGDADRNYFFFEQLGNIAIGLVVWAGAWLINYQTWRRWSPIILLGAVVATILLLVPGLTLTKNGATRWLSIAGLSVQPAEILKLGLILYLAVWLEKKGDRLRQLTDGLLPFAIMLGLASVAVVVFQRDMGTALVIIGSALGMYFVAGAPLRHMLAILSAGLAAGWLAIAMFPHRLARLTTFLNPDRDPTGQGYHISQALIAIGSGGIFGVGLGKSIQVYGYLPEAANDSIFAIIAEEFGLVGAVVILVLFGLVVYRGLMVASQAPDTFARLVALGVSLWILFQALINVAAMLSLVPLTGIPLPFISYGGSSLVFSLAATGILLNISKYTLREVAHEGTRERWRNSWAYHSNSSNGRRVKVAR